jgi:hypothetical protein
LQSGAKGERLSGANFALFVTKYCEIQGANELVEIKSGIE